MGLVHKRKKTNNVAKKVIQLSLLITVLASLKPLLQVVYATLSFSPKVKQTLSITEGGEGRLPSSQLSMNLHFVVGH